MMKAVLSAAACVFFLSGCATYRFLPAKEPYGKGYVVARDGVVVPEYTVGSANATPELPLAKERFVRRRGSVEYYYKKMGLVENRFRENIIGRAGLVLKMVTGVFRVPGLMIEEYRLGHNPAYRAEKRRLQEERDAYEDARVKQLREGLRSYVDRDLALENSLSQPPAP